MSVSRIMMYVMGILLASTIIVYIYLSLKNKNNRKNEAQQLKFKKSTKSIFWLFKIYSKTPILNRYYYRLLKKMEIQFPADTMEVRKRTTSVMTRALLIALGLMGVVIFTCKGDIFFVLAGVFMIYVMFTYFINNMTNKMEGKLLVQLGDFITDVRHYYASTGDVADAIYDTLNDVPYEIGLHVSRIHSIISSVHMQEEVDIYADVAPNKFVMTFVAICASIREYGDKELDNGQSLFLTNINYLKDEINVELLKRKRNEFMFSGLVLLTLLPMFFIKPIEMWGTSNIPEMTSFYTGSGGTISMAAIFALTLLTYNMIITLKDGKVEDMKEYKLINLIIKRVPFVNYITTLIINHNYTKARRTEDNLKMVGDNISYKGFLVKKALYALVAIVAVNILIFMANDRSKANILNDFSETLSSSIVPSEEFRSGLQEIAKDYTNLYKKYNPDELSKGQLEVLIMEEQGINKIYATAIVDEVFSRLVKYHNVYYKWWFIFIVCLGALVGWVIPSMLLKYQLSIVMMNMEDEVIQFQTLVLILMHVDGMMVDTILEWMERFAFCFKDSIQECIINLEYSTQKALMKMKFRETFPPFRRFVDNLLAVEDEDIESAFREIEVDREYYKEKRKQDNEIVATSKAEKGKMIAFIPLFATLGLYLILPFGQFAFNMISQVSTAF